MGLQGSGFRLLSWLSALLGSFTVVSAAGEGIDQALSLLGGTIFTIASGRWIASFLPRDVIAQGAFGLIVFTLVFWGLDKVEVVKDKKGAKVILALIFGIVGAVFLPPGIVEFFQVFIPFVGIAAIFGTLWFFLYKGGDDKEVSVARRIFRILFLGVGMFFLTQFYPYIPGGLDWVLGIANLAVLIAIIFEIAKIFGSIGPVGRIASAVGERIGQAGDNLAGKIKGTPSGADVKNSPEFKAIREELEKDRQHNNQAFNDIKKMVEESQPKLDDYLRKLPKEVRDGIKAELKDVLGHLAATEKNIRTAILNGSANLKQELASLHAQLVEALKQNLDDAHKRQLEALKVVVEELQRNGTQELGTSIKNILDHYSKLNEDLAEFMNEFRSQVKPSQDETVAFINQKLTEFKQDIGRLEQQIAAIARDIKDNYGAQVQQQYREIERILREIRHAQERTVREERQEEAALEQEEKLALNLDNETMGIVRKIQNEASTIVPIVQQERASVPEKERPRIADVVAKHEKKLNELSNSLVEHALALNKIDLLNRRLSEKVPEGIEGTQRESYLRLQSVFAQEKEMAQHFVDNARLLHKMLLEIFALLRKEPVNASEIARRFNGSVGNLSKEGLTIQQLANDLAKRAEQLYGMHKQEVLLIKAMKENTD